MTWSQHTSLCHLVLVPGTQMWQTWLWVNMHNDERFEESTTSPLNSVDPTQSQLRAGYTSELHTIPRTLTKWRTWNTMAVHSDTYVLIKLLIFLLCSRSFVMEQKQIQTQISWAACKHLCPAIHIPLRRTILHLANLLPVPIFLKRGKNTFSSGIKNHLRLRIRIWGVGAEA